MLAAARRAFTRRCRPHVTLALPWSTPSPWRAARLDPSRPRHGEACRRHPRRRAGGAGARHHPDRVATRRSPARRAQTGAGSAALNRQGGPGRHYGHARGGKSTTIDALGVFLTDQGHKVAVLTHIVAHCQKRPRALAGFCRESGARGEFERGLESICVRFGR